jgi:hypothetical protein
MMMFQGEFLNLPLIADEFLTPLENSQPKSKKSHQRIDFRSDERQDM